MGQISCVLFDLGGVLINWQNSWLIESVSKQFHLSKQKVTDSFEKNLSDYSKGKLNEITFWHIIGKDIDSLELMNITESLYDEICSQKIKIH